MTIVSLEASRDKKLRSNLSQVVQFDRMKTEPMKKGSLGGRDLKPFWEHKEAPGKIHPRFQAMARQP